MIKKYNYNIYGISEDIKNFLEGNETENLEVVANTIRSYAFYKFENLNSVILSKNLTSIGMYAFAECLKLSRIKYLGTKAEWNLIYKGDSWNRNTLVNNIECSDGIVSI